MTIDELISVICRIGRFQVLLFFMLALSLFIVACNNLVVIFYQFIPPHHCKVSQNLMNVSLPLSDSNPHGYKSCEQYVNPNNHSQGTEACEEYQYYPGKNEWTITQEWDLVCDWLYFSSLMNSIYFGGMAVPAIIFGILSDYFGRRPIIIFCMYCQIAFGIALYFATQLSAFVVLRTIVGGFTQGVCNVSFTLLLEMTMVRYRGLAAAGFCLFWNIGSFALGVTAYFIRDWRTLQLAITVPFIISCIYLWWLPESVRWSLSVGKVKQAQETITKLIRWNNVNVKTETIENLKYFKHETNKPDKKQTYNFTHLFRTPQLRKHTLIVAYTYFALCLCYYGILFNLTDLSGDKYTNFLMGAAFDFAATIFAILVIERFPRKVLVISSLCIGGVTCIIGIVCQNIASQTTTIGIIGAIFMQLSKAAIVSTFAFYTPYSPELFPTILRSTGFGVGIFTTRLASVLAPQMTIIGKYTYKPVPFICYAVFMLIGALLCLLLPETKGRPMFDTIEDLENTLNNKGNTKSNKVEVINKGFTVTEEKNVNAF